MVKKETNEERFSCPVGRLLRDFEEICGKKSEFFEHMAQSRIEFLKGIRSLVDERIEHLEKKRSAKGGKKMTKIEVE
jgi:hypothetical protein